MKYRNKEDHEATVDVFYFNGTNDSYWDLRYFLSKHGGKILHTGCNGSRFECSLSPYEHTLLIPWENYHEFATELKSNQYVIRNDADYYVMYEEKFKDIYEEVEG